MKRALFALLLAACGSKPAPPIADPLVIEDAGTFGIRREVLTWAAPAPPRNPAADAGTPSEFNRVQVVRYRVDTGAQPPRPARAIAILMPGFLGGAGSFDALARALVRRSTADATLEAWAVDRRANLLEDHAGLEAALAARDANLVGQYYFEAGSKFSGFRKQEDVPYESEWGLATTVDDLRAVIAQIPAAERKGRVVLVGHSLGGQIAAQYAAWDFDGQPGSAELAGLVMIDAVTGHEGQPSSLTRAQYETDGFMDPDGFGSVQSLTEVRAATRFFTLPILETSLYVVGSGTAMRALWNPDALEKDVKRAEALKLLFGTDALPPMTNRAAFGLAFDYHSCPLSIAAVNAGESTGGPLTEGPSPFGTGTVAKPSDPKARYSWREYDQVTPREFTSLTDFATAWTRPGVDFGEWYFPTRLNLDTFAAASLTLKPGDWAYDTEGLRASRGAQIDLPVLVEAGVLSNGDVTAYDKLKALITPTVGPGRPLAGATRSSNDGWETAPFPSLSHIDVLAGVDEAGGPTRAWYDQLTAFVVRNTPTGGVQIQPK